MRLSMRLSLRVRLRVRLRRVHKAFKMGDIIAKPVKFM